MPVKCAMPLWRSFNFIKRYHKDILCISNVAISSKFHNVGGLWHRLILKIRILFLNVKSTGWLSKTFLPALGNPSSDVVTKQENQTRNLFLVCFYLLFSLVKSHPNAFKKQDFVIFMHMYSMLLRKQSHWVGALWKSHQRWLFYESSEAPVFFNKRMAGSCTTLEKRKCIRKNRIKR